MAPCTRKSKSKRAKTGTTLQDEGKDLQEQLAHLQEVMQNQLAHLQAENSKLLKQVGSTSSKSVGKSDGTMCLKKGTEITQFPPIHPHNNPPGECFDKNASGLYNLSK